MTHITEAQDVHHIRGFMGMNECILAETMLHVASLAAESLPEKSIVIFVSA